MNKRHILSLAIFAASFLIVATGHASMMVPAQGPQIFNEVFLGGSSDSDYMNMAERGLLGDLAYDAGNKAKFWFDLGNIGGEGRLLNTSGTGDRRVQIIDPTTDETTFDPLLFETPFAAYVDFYFSDFLYDTPSGSPEKVRIDLEAHKELVSLDFTLENDPDGQRMIRIDLGNFGLLDELMDGQLLATVIAPDFGFVDNTFILDRVELTAEAMPQPMTPVPIPSAALLLGAGLVGLVGIRSRSS